MTETSVNTVTVSGTLQSAELRYTAKGDPVSNATLELTDSWRDGKAKRQWLRVVLWKGLATKAAELPKDSVVRIAGRLETASWQDKETGQKKYRTQIVAASLEPIQHLQEIPAPKEETKKRQDSGTQEEKRPAPKRTSKVGGDEIARAILSPPVREYPPLDSPITDEDIPF